MNRLTQIEAARVISVLRDTSEKLKVLLDVHLEWITPDIPPELVPEDILQLLLKQKENETKYQELFEMDKEYKAQNLRAKIRENLTEMNESRAKIKDNCQNLQRKLKDSPTTLDQLRQLGPKSDQGKRFVEMFDLLVRLSKVRLETTVEEELEKIKRMEVLAAKESKVMSDKVSLKKELDAEEKTRSKEVSQLRENEQRLSQQIQKMKSDNKAFLARVNANLIAMRNDLEKKRDIRLEELKNTNENLTQELHALILENKMKEREIRKTKQQTGLEIENRVVGYDQQMREKKKAQENAEIKLDDERLQEKILEEEVLGLDRRKKIDEFKDKLQEKLDAEALAKKIERHTKISYIQAMYYRRRAIQQLDELKKTAARKAKKAKGSKKKKKKK